MTAPRHPSGDTGSVTPLIIGMTLCLLLLGAGITAAGSAFLAGQQAQHLCDGAVAAAAGTLTAATTGDDQAADAVARYLAVHHDHADTTLSHSGDTLTLICSTDAPISFGALFGSPTLPRTTVATAHIYLR